MNFSFLNTALNSYIVQKTCIHILVDFIVVRLVRHRGDTERCCVQNACWQNHLTVQIGCRIAPQVYLHTGKAHSDTWLCICRCAKLHCSMSDVALHDGGLDPKPELLGPVADSFFMSLHADKR